MKRAPSSPVPVRDFYAMVAEHPRWIKVVEKIRKYGGGTWQCLTESEERDRLARLIQQRRIDLRVTRRFEPELQKYGLTYPEFLQLWDRHSDVMAEICREVRGIDPDGIFGTGTDGQSRPEGKRDPGEAGEGVRRSSHEAGHRAPARANFLGA